MFRDNILVVVLSSIIAVPMWALWNTWVVPSFVTSSEISYIQALGISLIITLFVKMNVENMEKL